MPPVTSDIYYKKILLASCYACQSNYQTLNMEDKLHVTILLP